MSPKKRFEFALRTLTETPGLWRRDKRDRTDFLRYFYQRYKGAPLKQLERDAAEMLSDLILIKSFPAGLRRCEHRAAGHQTVLITGALDTAVEPLRPRPHNRREIDRKDGKLTGEMFDVPPQGKCGPN